MENGLKYAAGAVVFGAVYGLVWTGQVQPGEFMNLCYVLLGAIGVQRISSPR